MRKPLVSILGCGPAGLLAAHACAMRDVPFVIFSKKQKSVIGGAQFSHIAIPGIHDDPETSDVMLEYRRSGDAQTYHNKVYGSEVVPFVSFDNIHDGQMVPAWNLIYMYDKLWELYSGSVVDLDLDPDRLESLLQAFDAVFSSVPLTHICLSGLDTGRSHWFKSQTIRILNEALMIGIPDNTIVYDGTKDHSWYRMSKIFGVGSTEWGGASPLPPIQNLRTVNKPIATNCDCFCENPFFRKIGRFGQWKKGVLTFHAYNRVIDTLMEMGIE